MQVLMIQIVREICQFITLLVLDALKTLMFLWSMRSPLVSFFFTFFSSLHIPHLCMFVCWPGAHGFKVTLLWHFKILVDLSTQVNPTWIGYQVNSEKVKAASMLLIKSAREWSLQVWLLAPCSVRDKGSWPTDECDFGCWVIHYH